MRKKPGTARTTVLGAVILGLSATMAAAPAVAMDRMAQAQPQEGAFSDQQLQAYAKSVIEVQQINMSMEQEMQAAQDPADKEAVQKQAYTDLEAVIASNGLSVEEYNAITAQAQSDEATREKVTAYLQQMQGGGNM
ncbi:conserved hypothetical protein [Parvibaculum lavamentivorans DS-1]|uniref:DUF4168 domain-containing protein n=1 Tax=Parvibaculum lavamentivorans (strain DS-1 / DSM 13023 / NCIMB 13966) TaxID=402881 RepID=A7HXY7_PARL1|nr:DUF4168 domain-containing protein [Parvibaculum lavamentivorans]ABS64770.1 conserved hypothetical protein [Parvibaculum lavamentivorans DS-1]